VTSSDNFRPGPAWQSPRRSYSAWRLCSVRLLQCQGRERRIGGHFSRAEGEGEMISWRLVVPAVLVAAAIAGCLTYFVTPSPPVEAVQRIPPTSPDIRGPDRTTRTSIDQHSSAEAEAKAAFERAAAAILRRAPDLQASAGANEPPTAEHIPLPKRRPRPRP
jgi:hypothetical protein